MGTYYVARRVLKDMIEDRLDPGSRGFFEDLSYFRSFFQAKDLIEKRI